MDHLEDSSILRRAGHLLNGPSSSNRVAGLDFRSAEDDWNTNDPGGPAPGAFCRYLTAFLPPDCH